MIKKVVDLARLVVTGKIIGEFFELKRKLKTSSEGLRRFNVDSHHEGPKSCIVVPTLNAGRCLCVYSKAYS